MGLNGWMARKTATWRDSFFMSNEFVQYVGAFCGPFSGVLFFLTFIVANFLPPPGPTWDADHMAAFYKHNNTRIRAAAAILMISGGFYLPFSTCLSYQIRRVPRIPWIIHQMQLASAAAGIWTYMLPGIVLAVASYRPDRPAEITHLMNDFFWIVAIMPWPTFMVQNFSFAFAILYDNRKVPLFPKELALFNIFMPILFATATGIHTETRGPFAYNGAITFWIVGFTFVFQLIVDGIFLARAARHEARNALSQGDDESNVDSSAVDSSALSKSS